jgi:hypothetical protein
MTGHPNLKVYLDFQDNCDNKGNGAAVFIEGSASYGAGLFGKAWSNDGSANRADCGTNALSTNAPFTIATWVYPTSYSSYNAIFYINNPSLIIELRLGRETGTDGFIQAFILYGGVGHVNPVSSYEVPLNTWTHLAFTFNGADPAVGKLYINGAFDCQGNEVGTYNVQSSTGLKIGGIQAGFDFIGKIDNAQIYDIALPPSDIRRIMNGLHPLTRS